MPGRARARFGEFARDFRAGYDLPMLNNIQPALYIRLRRHSNLTRTQFAVRLDVSRNTLRSYEAGDTRPDPDTERKIIEVSRCSDLELVEMLCEIASDKLGMRVAILDGEDGYRPTTSLAKAQWVRRHYADDLSEAQRSTTRCIPSNWRRSCASARTPISTNMPPTVAPRPSSGENALQSH